MTVTKSILKPDLNITSSIAYQSHINKSLRSSTRASTLMTQLLISTASAVEPDLYSNGSNLEIMSDVPVNNRSTNSYWNIASINPTYYSKVACATSSAILKAMDAPLLVSATYGIACLDIVQAKPQVCQSEECLDHPYLGLNPTDRQLNYIVEKFKLEGGICYGVSRHFYETKSPQRLINDLNVLMTSRGKKGSKRRKRIDKLLKIIKKKNSFQENLKWLSEYIKVTKYKREIIKRNLNKLLAQKVMLSNFDHAIFVEKIQTVKGYRYLVIDINQPKKFKLVEKNEAANIITKAFTIGGRDDYITWQSNENLNIKDCENANNLKLFKYSQVGSVNHIRELVSQKGINVNQVRTDSGATPLYIASQEGHEDVVKLLLKQKGIDINLATIDKGLTPLYIASQNGHEGVVKLLLKQKGIKVNQSTTDNGGTPLYIASQNGHKAIVEILLKKEGINVNQARTDSGATPLYIASQVGYKDIVELLLKQKEINVNQARTDIGAPPLSVAISQGHEKVVKLLLDYSDNIDVTFNGYNAIAVAKKMGQKAIVKLLKKHQKSKQNQ
ncbi:hypothetical protein DID75_05965 [Candidatus Marinamargulisbacteria bacterium SCGC AG-410-N11]|nr:hypothetical protein DID75_05965 [Candidatus Marinamargulisbacteria bacterium SCGC AG-410-N11]